MTRQTTKMPFHDGLYLSFKPSFGFARPFGAIFGFNVGQMTRNRVKGDVKSRFHFEEGGSGEGKRLSVAEIHVEHFGFRSEDVRIGNGNMS